MNASLACPREGHPGQRVAEVLGLHPLWHIAWMLLYFSSHLHLVQLGRVLDPRA